jgi:hypothetical protein
MAVAAYRAWGNLPKVLDNYLFNCNYPSLPVASNGHPIDLVTLQQVKQTPPEAWQHPVSDIIIPVDAGIAIRPDQMPSVA